MCLFLCICPIVILYYSSSYKFHNFFINYHDNNKMHDCKELVGLLLLLSGIQNKYNSVSTRISGRTLCIVLFNVQLGEEP